MQETVKKDDRKSGMLLIFSTMMMAVCGLIYELLAGTLSSYLLGDSVTQFSIIIGWFLTCMGIGSFFSKKIKKNQLAWLITIEILIGFIGGIMGLTAFAAFALTEIYFIVLMSMTGFIGIMVGLEIPLVLRILETFDELKVTVANVMGADYIGALMASLLFPFMLLPYLGLTKAGIITGIANIIIAVMIIHHFKIALDKAFRKLAAFAYTCLLILIALFFVCDKLTSNLENRMYSR